MRKFLDVPLLVGSALLVSTSAGAQTTAPPKPKVAPATTPKRIVDPAIPARVPQHFPAGWHLPAGQQASFAEQAMAVSNSPEASRAAVEILKAGGNAVDAAVALGFALAVTWPEAGNIGGGGYMVIHMADGRETTLDYREVAPIAASRNMYLDANGKLTNKSIVGHLSVGVPGSVSGLTEALKKYGTMPLAKVMAPAIRLARDGFIVDSALGRGIAGGAKLLAQFNGGALFVPNGAPIKPGTLFKQPDMARTLQAIADGGAKAFYEGWIADSLVAEEKRGGGIITKADLAKYTPKWREPVKSKYREYSLIAMPPSSSGGVTMTEALNVLEQYPKLPPFGSTAYFHAVASAFQLAFIDRNSKLADPDFVPVPMKLLTDKKYAKALRATIDDNHATPTKVLEPKLEAAAREGSHTTHYSVVDAFGNAVANTTTLNNSWGSGVWVRGAGFMLNDEMDDFAAQPGTANMFGLVQLEQNAIQPGKRMLSAMSPTIVLDKNGNVLLVVGAAGGPTIITGTAEVILNVLDNRMNLSDAMRAPRVHHQALPDSITFENGGITAAVLDSLRAMGHGLKSTSVLVNVNAIMRVKGGWEGVPEPRRSGGAFGY
ncbi:MAG: gamma-glutamyltransferase [Gemmatimonadaceae bacterium]